MGVLFHVIQPGETKTGWNLLGIVLDHVGEMEQPRMI